MINANVDFQSGTLRMSLRRHGIESRRVFRRLHDWTDRPHCWKRCHERAGLGRYQAEREDEILEIRRWRIISRFSRFVLSSLLLHQVSEHSSRKEPLDFYLLHDYSRQASRRQVLTWTKPSAHRRATNSRPNFRLLPVHPKAKRKDLL